MTSFPQLTNPGSNLYIPDGAEPGHALTRTTHLGIGAHQDDLEFMAMHGILECYENMEKWFAGITCTNGGGCARAGPFSGITDEEMQTIRAEEQREAARVGGYAFMAQLGYSSKQIKGGDKAAFYSDLERLIAVASPQVIYTHNPADKHATHIAVLAGVVEAIRALPTDDRPKQLIGCEGWRDLDWVPDNKKHVMDLSSNLELAKRLNGIFKSQIMGGKRYDLAVLGRRQAHATFLDSHSVDAAASVCFGIDLTPLIMDDSLSIRGFTMDLLDEFRSEVITLLDNI